MFSEPITITSQSTNIDSISDMSKGMQTNLVRAVNKTIAWSRTLAAREIRKQVNLSASYLSGEKGRLKITQQASSNDLSAIITGRHRPTSLATFASNARSGFHRGARITVQPGLSRFMPKAFFVPLRSGNTDTKNNVGLAIRLPVGQRPNRAYKPTPLSKGTWLLYGPSVDQVFDDVALEISPAVADYLEAEFFRLTDAGI